MNQFQASYMGNLQWFQENTHDVNATDEWKQTTLMHAASNGHLELCTYLLSKGAPVNAQDDAGWAAIIHAIFRGHTHICSLLISHGASVNIRANNLMSALMYAAVEGRKDITRLLLSKGASTDTMCESQYTANRCHRDICALLLSYGASTSAGRIKTVMEIDLLDNLGAMQELINTFIQTPRTLKYYVLKLQPHTNYKLLLTRNTYEREVAAF